MKERRQVEQFLHWVLAQLRSRPPAGETGAKLRQLALPIGPMPGAFGEDHFTVTCRMSVPPKVALHAFDKVGKQLRTVLCSKLSTA